MNNGNRLRSRFAFSFRLFAEFLRLCGVSIRMFVEISCERSFAGLIYEIASDWRGRRTSVLRLRKILRFPNFSALNRCRIDARMEMLLRRVNRQQICVSILCSLVCMLLLVFWIPEIAISIRSELSVDSLKLEQSYWVVSSAGCFWSSLVSMCQPQVNFSPKFDWKWLMWSSGGGGHEEGENSLTI